MLKKTHCIVLDAMGVIFRAADDVAELLIPFITEAGGNVDAKTIASAYFDASLGMINADEFWNKVHLDPSLEDDYLSRHSLVPGVEDFLRNAGLFRIPVWCLSNDIGRWSAKLRTMFKISGLLAGAVISSEARVRKPDRAIYQCLLDRSGYKADELLFIDDRIRNVEAAMAMGIPSVQFTMEPGFQGLIKQVFGNAAS
ncbi:MAG: HAD-IA family hydrolase [Bacteroidota bacterium]